jgi:cell division protein FtsW (lipid II flippase)
MTKYLSKTDLIVIIITAVLFIIALFMKGFTKELLLEAGVLLVSIKLILMNHKNASVNEIILKKLEQINQQLEKGESKEF